MLAEFISGLPINRLQSRAVSQIQIQTIHKLLKLQKKLEKENDYKGQRNCM
jgi:hypothetical protein